MQERDALALLKKHREGTATEAEKALLDSWYMNWRKDEAVGLTEADYIKAEEEILRKLPAAPIQIEASPVVWKLGLRIAIAAAVATIIFGMWFYTSRYPDGEQSNYVSSTNDVGPGKNTATLTLANGKTFTLSDTKEGVIIGNDLRYNDSSLVTSSSWRGEMKRRSHDEVASIPRNDGMVQTLTATTPKGGNYQLRLPDGTHVWLNAESKISFPSHFNGNERRIILDGEAYLEVSKDKNHPFIVQTDRQEVEVLGTHLNIDSYADHVNVRTTVVEGAVKVRGRDAVANEVTLKTGQEASLEQNFEIRVKEVTDIEDAAAWRTMIVFDNEYLGSALREIGRWYNVFILYQGNINTATTISGRINKKRNLSSVIEMLEATGTHHYKIEGRILTVMK